MADDQTQIFEDAAWKYHELGDLFETFSQLEYDKPEERLKLQNKIEIAENEIIAMRGLCTPYLVPNVLTPEDKDPRNVEPEYRFALNAKSPLSEFVNRLFHEGRESEAAAVALVAQRSVAFWFNTGEYSELAVHVSEARKLNQDALVVLNDREVDLKKFIDTIGSNWAPANDKGQAIFSPTNSQVRVVIYPGWYSDDPWGVKSDLVIDACNAVAQLHQQGIAECYLDAGNSKDQQLSALQWIVEQGISSTTNLAGNVGAFNPTEQENAYLAEMSKELGGRRWLIDTGRNGKNTEQFEFCNPSDVFAGAIPTINTGLEFCDAFAWVWTPGMSDGDCNGGPERGELHEQWVIEFAERSAKAGLI